MFRKKSNFIKKQLRDNEELTPWERQQIIREEQFSKKKKKNKDKFVNKNLVKFNGLRKKRLEKRVTTLSIIFTLSAIISLYAILPISRVASVKVEGTDLPTEKLVISASDITKWESLFVVISSENSIRHRIKEKLPTIKDIDILIRKNTITLKVKEYTIVGYLQRKDNYYKLASNGNETNVGKNAISGSYPMFLQFKDKLFLKKAAAQIGKIPMKIRMGISEVHAIPSKIDSEKVKLIMNDGNEVIGTLSTLPAKMNYYPSMAKAMDKKGIIDIEVGAYSYPYK